MWHASCRGAYTALTGLCLAGVLALVPLARGPAHASDDPGAALSKPEQRCVLEMSKQAFKVARTQGKRICRCIKDGAKDKLDGQSIEDCAADSENPKVAKAQARLLAKVKDRCTGQTPGFARPLAGVDPNGLNAAALASGAALLHGILGPNLDAVTLPAKDTNDPVVKPSSKCQLNVAKAAKSCFDARWKVYNRCKKDGLKSRSPPGPIDSAGDLERLCLRSDPNDPATRPDDVKILKSCQQKLQAKIDRRCGEGSGADVSRAFPSFDPNTADLRTFVDQRVACEFCLLVGRTDGLDRDCDLFDDGQADASCSPPPTISAIDAVLFASGFSQPTHLTAPPAEPNAPASAHRVFVVEQPGRIRIVKDGVVLAAAFLDISLLVLFGGERGLLSMAFHPDYWTNGHFFVNYTRSGDGATVVARYTVSADPDLADGASGTVFLTQSQPFANHNGGQLAFGPDGFLYIGMGDGGSGGDPLNAGQNDAILLGKLLRVDVDVAGPPFGIPSTNPDPNSEIWAKGLRNPWRFSFDRLTGDLYIADVGQNSWEEVDFQPAASSGGENYGWRLLEGPDCFNPASVCDPGGMTTLPVHAYDHANDGGRAIIGGMVYRGSAIPGLQGSYFYADSQLNAFVQTIRVVDGVVQEFRDVTLDLEDQGQSIRFPTSFGEDVDGELYITLGGGNVLRIELGD